ncbi:MAG: transposase [Nitrosomonas sp.]|nr:transposase [Nitrosomonas sp.]
MGRGIQLDYIQPGKPQQNAYVERYNSAVRHEWLEMKNLQRLRKHNLQQHNGFGFKIMYIRIWHSEVSRQP